MRVRLLLALAFVAAFPALASIDVTWTFVNFVSEPQAVKGVKVTPLAPWGTNAAGIVTGDYRQRQTAGNGSLTITNMTAGYAYRVNLSGTFGDTTFTNYFPAGLTGAINATDYLTPTNPAAFLPYYSANLRFVPPLVGSNAAGITYVVSTNSGGSVPSGTFVTSHDGQATNLIVWAPVPDRLLGFAIRDIGPVLDIDYVYNGGDDYQNFEFLSSGGPAPGSFTFDGPLAGWGITSTAPYTNRFLGRTIISTLEATNLTSIASSGSSDAITLKSGNGTIAVDIISGEVDFNVLSGSIGSYNFDQDIVATAFTGSGSGLTSLNASSIASGTLNPTRLATTNNVKGTTNWVFVIQGGSSFWTNVIPQSLLNPNSLTNNFAGAVTFGSSLTVSGSNTLGQIQINTIGATISGGSNTVTTNLMVPSGTLMLNNTVLLLTNGSSINTGTGSNYVRSPFAGYTGFSTTSTSSSGGAIFGLFGTTFEIARADRAFAWQFDFSGSGRIIAGTGINMASSPVTNASGFGTSATNTLAFTTVGFFTNTLGVNATAYFSAGSSAVVSNEFNNVVVSISSPTVIQLHPNWKVSGTTMSATLVAQ